MYTSHLMNCMSSTAIGGKTPLDNWLGRASQEYSLLQVFKSPAYFSAKEGKINPSAKKFVFLGIKRSMKGYKL